MTPTSPRLGPISNSHRLQLLALAALCALAASDARAQDARYFYFDLGGGQTRGDLEERGLTNRVSAPVPGGYTN